MTESIERSIAIFWSGSGALLFLVYGWRFYEWWLAQRQLLVAPGHFWWLVPVGTLACSSLGWLAGTAEFWGGLFFLLWLLFLTVTDLAAYWLPDGVTYSGFVGAFFWRWWVRPENLWEDGLAIAGSSLLLAYFAWRGSLGWGDIKLMAGIGWMVGFPGLLLTWWVATALLLAFLLFCYSQRRPWPRHRPIPFAPCLAGGGFFAYWSSCLVLVMVFSE